MEALADDAAIEPEEKGPERTCIVTREKRGKDKLIRFVLSPEGLVVPDIRARLPGRGVWTLARADTVALAVKRKAFARSLKRTVEVPAELPAIVDGLLEADALQFLAMVQKAGHVISGTAKVESAIADKAVVALIHAAEAGQDGMRKLAAALRRRFGPHAAGVDLIHLFASERLDLALGRTHVIHAALTAGAVSEGFIARSRRLARYRGFEPLFGVDLAERDIDVQA